MKPVPASLALLMLHQEADRTGDDRYRISPATLRQWVKRGHITRGTGGYDLAEITAYLDRPVAIGQRVRLAPLINARVPLCAGGAIPAIALRGSLLGPEHRTLPSRMQQPRTATVWLLSTPP
jgi:hypothetical protein